MKYRAVYFVLLWVMVGCGGDAIAPIDATVTGPKDGAFSVISAVPTVSVLRGADFLVKGKEGTAIPGVEIEFFALGEGSFISELNDVSVSNLQYVKTITSDRGHARVSLSTTLPPCSSEDRDVVAALSASVKTAGHATKVTYTVKSC